MKKYVPALKRFAAPFTAAVALSLATAASGQAVEAGHGPSPDRGPRREPRPAPAMRAGNCDPTRQPGGDRFGFIVPILRQEGAAEKIGLDAEAAKSLAETLAGLDQKIEASNAALKDAVKRQAEALEKDSPDENEVLDAVNAVWDIRRDVAILQTRKLLAIRSSLTPAQIAVARKLLRKAWNYRNGEGGEEGFGGGRGPRRGPGARRGEEGPGRGRNRRPEGAPPPDDGEPPHGDAPDFGELPLPECDELLD